MHSVNASSYELAFITYSSGIGRDGWGCEIKEVKECDGEICDGKGSDRKGGW